MKRAAAMAVAGLLFGGTALAYDWNGAKWQVPRGGGVPYVVSNNLSADVPDRDALEAIQIGFDVWTALPCSFMAWSYQGRTANTRWGAGDGENVTSWREESWDDSPTALAIASTIWNFQGNLEDTDIKFNGFHHSWAHFRDAPGGFDGRTDIASVGAHEVGHCIGLGHSDVPGSTMWPSTGPGDVGGRSLGADDIAGACEVYPSGGEVPPPDDDRPPPPGNVPFGGDCSMARCAEGLFCVSDGRESYCSRVCNPGDESCGNGFYCARLSGGGGACAKGEDPAANLAGFGEDCGDRQCQAGLICVNDDGSFYCTGPCANGMCPNNWFCAQLQNGDEVCARGEGGNGGQLPGPGEPCDARGLCARGYFCLNDPLNVDEDTGDTIPYCTNDCDDGPCAEGFRCVDLQPAGTACQLIPTAGDRALGQECWVNPERPWERPSCGDGLVCVDFRVENDAVVEKGFCTKNCTVQDCCPVGWGCLEITPVIGQCREGRPDDQDFVCGGDRPGAGGEGGGGGGGIGTDGGVDGVDNPVGADGGGGGCTAGGRPMSPWGPLALLGLVGLVALRRRRT